MARRSYADVLLYARNNSGLVTGWFGPEPKGVEILNSGTAKRELHVTISAAPYHAEGISDQTTALLANDFRLVKAALLYADHTTLVSPASMLVLYSAVVGRLPEREQLDLLVVMYRSIASSDPNSSNLLENLGRFERISQKLKTGHYVSLRDREFYKILRDRLLHELPNTVEVFDKIAEDAGAKELVSVLKSELIELYPFQTSIGDMDQFMEEWVGVLGNSVSSGNTYPLFDEQVGGLIRLGIQEGKIAVSEAGTFRGKHSGLAANLIERLPLFEEASVAEVLDIRKELNDPLVRFRRAVIRFSNDIKSASWDDNFAGEAQNVFMRDVEPAVQEIEEAIHGNRFLLQLMRKASAQKGRIAAGVAGSPALGILMSQLGELSQVTSVSGAAAGGAALMAMFTAFEALDDWTREKQRINQNDLFFYYRARKAFSKLR